MEHYLNSRKKEKGKRKKERKTGFGKAWLLLICFSIIVFSNGVLFSQSVPKNSYWIQLKDKNGTTYQVTHPEAFLSQRAINRRIKQQIAIDETDLPVSQVYLDSLKNRSFEIFHTSKWLNGVTVRTADTTLIKNIELIEVLSDLGAGSRGAGFGGRSGGRWLWRFCWAW